MSPREFTLGGSYDPEGEIYPFYHTKEVTIPTGESSKFVNLVYRTRLGSIFKEPRIMGEVHIGRRNIQAVVPDDVDGVCLIHVVKGKFLVRANPEDVCKWVWPEII